MASLKPTDASEVCTMPFSSGERAVVELHGDTLEGLEGLLDRGFDQLEDHRLVGAKHGAGGDAEKQGVTNLAGGAGDCDTDGGLS